ncbi:sensor histidine kinase [Govanella unica]|uniref:histidine kinase n=1 Tax=Govanella unica TaxID=2975056 RepID=A0A9X3TV78_9PROT|nr:HAMP domain-containing sensor histidine kinase [Govania unica]MDA5192463.1 HAMP domain-containing histidine kinase [Govania unica]
MTAEAKPVARRQRWWEVSLATRLIILVLIFLAVPVVLYRLFEAADDDKRILLLDSVYERGRLTMEVLRQQLETGGTNALPVIADQLQVLGAPDTVLRLFFRPGPTDQGGEAGFFYVAAAPARPVEELAREQAEMQRLGIFDRLGAACRDGVPQAARHQLGSAREEVVISVTPLQTPGGCWTLVTAFSTAAFRDSSIGRPYWETEEIRFGAVIYLGLFLVMATVLWSVWRGLKRLTARARLIREQGGSSTRLAHGFTELGGPREVNEVAEELDRLVQTLDSTAQTLREISHENAHAFKTPVAVIRQAIEPIKRRAEEPRLKRAVEVIELSLEKLDELIASAWRVDELMADLLHPPQQKVDLSSLLERLGRDYATLAQARRVTVLSQVEPGIDVRGSLDMLEAIIENLVDNAVSFTPSGGRVQLELAGDRGFAVLSVSDNGPGVSEDQVTRIFDRYFTTRSQGHKGAPGGHLGLGLWIVKRNVDALGGSIVARNRSEGGLKITLRLPRLGNLY